MSKTGYTRTSSQIGENQEQDHKRYKHIVPSDASHREELIRRMEILKSLPLGSKELQTFAKEQAERSAAKAKQRLAKKMEKAEIPKDTWELINKGRADWIYREGLRNEALHEYSKENPVVVESFVSDIKNLKEDESLYVFCFAYAKIQSTEYKEFLGSLTADNLSKVYIGRNTDLSMALMLSETSELRPGLHHISDVLGSRDDVGVLVTNETEDKILRKFRAYKEFDFAKPGNAPSETLMYAKGDVLPLPTNISAEKLFPILQELQMPVELTNDGRVIEMTQAYTVCEEKMRVTENASKILKHLNKKMINYIVLPVCRWAVSTKQPGYHYEYYYDRAPRPSRV